MNDIFLLEDLKDYRSVVSITPIPFHTVFFHLQNFLLQNNIFLTWDFGESYSHCTIGVSSCYRDVLWLWNSLENFKFIMTNSCAELHVILILVLVLSQAKKELVVKCLVLMD